MPAGVGAGMTFVGETDLRHEFAPAPSNSATNWFGSSGQYPPNNQVPGETVLNVTMKYNDGGTVRVLDINGGVSAGNTGPDTTGANLFLFARAASLSGAATGFVWDLEIWDGDPDAGGVIRNRFPMNEGVGNVFADELGGPDMVVIQGPGVAQWQLNQAEPVSPS